MERQKLSCRINLDLFELEEVTGMMEFQFEQGKLEMVAAYLPKLKKAVAKLEKHCNKLQP